MTTETTFVRATSPITSTVQSKQDSLPEYARSMIAEGEIDDQTFDRFFALTGKELADGLETGLRSRFIRLMVERYVSDDTISDHSFTLALKQIEDAATMVEADIYFAIEAEIQSRIDAGPATSLDVSIAQNFRDMDLQ